MAPPGNQAIRELHDRFPIRPQVLFERRQDLHEHILLADFIKRPDAHGGSLIPIHDGAEQFYERETPSILQENAGVIALALTLFALLVSLGMPFRGSAQRKVVRDHNETLLSYLKVAESTEDSEELECMANEINDLLIRASHDRNNHTITAEDFSFFSFVWTMARDEINESIRG